MIGVSRGDVVLCNFNPVTGTEQAGVRPAVVVQVDQANAKSLHTIVVPFTSKIRSVLLPSHAYVPAGAGGLTQDSVALCEQVRVIDGQRIIKVLGHLDPPQLADVEKAMRAILGL